MAKSTKQNKTLIEKLKKQVDLQKNQSRSSAEDIKCLRKKITQINNRGSQAIQLRVEALEKKVKDLTDQLKKIKDLSLK